RGSGDWSSDVCSSDLGLHSTYLLVTSRVTHASYDFAAALNWENEWKEIAKSSPVDQYRAALNQTRFPMPERDDIYTSEVRPILRSEERRVGSGGIRRV